MHFITHSSECTPSANQSAQGLRKAEESFVWRDEPLWRGAAGSMVPRGSPVAKNQAACD
jgi:hypothetical protein